ncbi:MAG TPA: hypothetical protein VMV52_03845 [Candidatus Nanopelagicaceae bacterium]|nr:hypothetical protein [Candidatus Nanopelagicaceae bacterium]
MYDSFLTEGQTMRYGRTWKGFGTAALALLVLTGGTSTSSAATGQVLTTKSNHSTVHVKLGSKLTLILNSTYWTVKPLRRSSSLRVAGNAIVKTILPSPDAPVACRHAGSGCGTVTVHYKAKHLGTALVRATRVTCGEALLCAPDQKTFSVRVKVKK